LRGVSGCARSGSRVRGVCWCMPRVCSTCKLS
jgi:hypothetical protein